MKQVSLPLGCCLWMVAAVAAAAAESMPSNYHLLREISLPGDDGWDYLSFDSVGHRLFVSHGTRVQVLDTVKGSLVGEIADTPGVHGIALATDLGRGYISAGRSGEIVVFDLKSLARLTTIKATGDNPDAILYDSATRRVFSFNGRGHNATAIDAVTHEVIGTIPLDAKPEFAASDGAGHIYVNLEDKSSLAVIDPRKLVVTAVWPLPGCEEPSGLALDNTHHRLFPVCDNKVMAVVDAGSGHVLATVPIGAGVDAAAYDPATQLAFASCGEGVLTVVKETRPGQFAAVQSVQTKPGARTMALDEGTHRVYLATAKVGPRPAPTAEQPHPRPPILPGSFEIAVVGP